MKISRLALVAGLLAAPAFARADDADPARQTIVVEGRADPLDLKATSSTGSRLGLTALETPATVQAITAADIEQRGLRTAREVFADVPGAIAGNVPGNPAVVMMRGFSGNAVSILQDGVRVSTSTVVQRDTNTWHFDRIEIIKGPASVLQGEGALGGIINKVTRKPTLDASHFDGMLSYGSFNTLNAAGGVNVKLSDKAAIRADVSQLSSDSLYDVAGNKTRSLGLTASLLVKPIEPVSILLAVDHYNDRANGTYQGAPLVQAATARQASNIVTTTNGLVLDRALARVNYNPDGGTSGADETTLRSRIDWAIGGGWALGVDLTYYTARRDFILSDTQTYAAPSTGYPDGSFLRTLQRFYHDHQFWNARAALSNEGVIAGLRNRATIGLEYNHTHFTSLRQSAPNTAVSRVDPYAPMVGTFPTADSVYTAGNQFFDSRLNTTSIFAEDALNLTKDWLLVGGIRTDSIDLNRQVTNYLVTPNSLQSANPHYHPLSWRIGTNYAVTPGLTLYAQHSTAAVPVSSMLLQSIVNTAFRITKGHSWEAGFKGSAWGGKLSATGAVYYIKQNDILTRDPLNPSLSVQGGSQSSRGAELSVEGWLSKQLSAGGSIGYVEAKYDQLIEAGGTVRTGNRPINTPTTTLSGRISYAIPHTPFSVNGIVRHASGFFTDTANSIHVAGHTTLDASVVAEIRKEVRMTLRGRNLTNAFYGEYSGYPTTNIYIGAPRSVELALGVHF